MKRFAALTLAFAITVAGVPPVYGLTGEEILDRAVEALSPSVGVQSTQSMMITTARGATQRRRLEYYRLGSEMVLLRFLAPADIRGVAVLVDSQDRDDDLIYLYMPAFRRERRIASHVKNEEFMGTGFTYEDIAELDYSDRYRVDSWSETTEGYRLNLQPKRGDVSYSRVVLEIEKESFLPTRTELYQGTRPVKTLTNEQITRHQGYWIPMKLTLENHDSGRKTVMEVETVEHGGLDESIFTVRSLRRFR